ncbi:MAG: DUF3025 domain-containing protein [Gallionellaceae bacterium]|jgi:hypothetical protein
MLQQTYYAIFQFMKPSGICHENYVYRFGYTMGMKSVQNWNVATLLQSPLFSPLQPVLSRLETQSFPTLHDFNSLMEGDQASISVQPGHRLRFVPQESGRLGFESQYEPRCYLTGEVQTRQENWHDLFNALVWLTFPRAKAAINARHYQALQHAAVETGSMRGKVRDMATLLDESGVIVVSANAGLIDLLYNFQWKELFWKNREKVSREMGFYIFGHGLYEKSLKPYVGMTGQGLVLQVDSEFFSRSLPEQTKFLDENLAVYLDNPQHCLSTRELHPVPLLGIPGWAGENTRETYYDNTAYFRSGRMQK